MTRKQKVWLSVLAALMLSWGLSINQWPEGVPTNPSMTEASDAAVDVSARPPAIADRPVSVDASSGPSAGKYKSPKVGALSEKSKHFMPVAYSDGMYWQHVLDCGLTTPSAYAAIRRDEGIEDFSDADRTPFLKEFDRGATKIAGTACEGAIMRALFDGQDGTYKRFKASLKTNHHVPYWRYDFLRQ